MNKYLQHYTIELLEEAWKDYTTRKVLKMLINGKWVVKSLDEHKKSPITATRAEVVVISKTMGFPKFLRKYYG